MKLGIQGKTALVTASSGGLGFAIAKALVSEGCKVVINSRNHISLKQSVNNLGADSCYVVGDLSLSTDRTEVLRSAREQVGDIDILVVSTAHPPTRPFSTATDDEWELGYQLLLRAPIELTRAVIPSMRQRGYGRLVYIGSIFGLEAEASSVIQSTFRAGLNNFAKCIAVEEAFNSITANVICPGYFDTQLVRDLAKQYADEFNTPVASVIDEWKAFSPMKRFGNPADIGAYVTFLCSDYGRFMSGSAIHIDGAAIKRV